MIKNKKATRYTNTTQLIIFNLEGIFFQTNVEIKGSCRSPINISSNNFMYRYYSVKLDSHIYEQIDAYIIAIFKKNGKNYVIYKHEFF